MANNLNTAGAFVCYTVPVTLNEGHRLGVFENEVIS